MERVSQPAHCAPLQPGVVEEPFLADRCQLQMQQMDGLLGLRVVHVTPHGAHRCVAAHSSACLLLVLLSTATRM
jgi:hypothetical protein